MCHAVDPGLELARDAEVVLRCANHDDVGSQQFGQPGFGAIQFGLLHGVQAILRAAQHGQQVAGQVGRGVLVQVTHGHLGAGVLGNQVGHHAGGQRARNGVVTKDAGIDLQDVHVFLH
ncbi:hypothetical protein D3C87_1785740 [compost metagenome]